MVMKSLILGVLCSVGIFAVKSGIGLSYCVARRRRIRSKVWAFLLFALTYLLVFIAAIPILQQADPIHHLPIIQRWMQSGMLMHLVIAVLMMGWGLILLKQNNNTQARSRGWLILAMPCPVCATVIILSAAVIISYFPEHPVLIALFFYLAFMALALFTQGIVHMYRKKSLVQPNGFLGGIMMLMATYFLLSAIIMPQFTDLGQVYRMACYRTDATSLNVTSVLNMILLIVATFAAGFGFTRKKIRSLQ